MKHPLSALSLDDAVVKGEVRRALDLRKTQLEKLKKSEVDAGVDSAATMDLLKLHSKEGINRFFSDEVSGTMFAIKWPLKELVTDGQDPNVLDNEGAAVSMMMAWSVQGRMDEGVPEVQWVDSDGRTFLLKLSAALMSDLAPAPPPPKVMSNDDPAPGKGTGAKVLDAKVKLAQSQIKNETALSVLVREHVLEWLASLTTDEQVTAATLWLDSDIPLDRKPMPPDGWERDAVSGAYEDVLTEHLVQSGRKFAKGFVVQMAADGGGCPFEFIPKDASGRGGGLTKADSYKAKTAWVNASGTQSDKEPTKLGAVLIGRGKKPHLIVADNPTDYFAQHTLCSRVLDGAKKVEHEWSLDEACGACLTLHNNAPPGTFEVV